MKTQFKITDTLYFQRKRMKVALLRLEVAISKTWYGMACKFLSDKLFGFLSKIIPVFLLLSIASCSKSQDNNPEPVKASTKVSYYVECTYCSVYVEDNVWNRNNHVEGRPDAVSQHFNVSGHWSYEFEVKGIDTVSIKIIGNSYAETGLVYARVSQDGNQKHFSGFLSPEKGNEAFVELAIKK